MEYASGELRKFLNDLNHDKSGLIDGLSESSILDTLNKIRAVLDHALGRSTKAPVKNAKEEKIQENLQPSLFDPYINSEQVNAIQSGSPFILVHAGPGTGKTYLLTERIIWSLKQSKDKEIIGLAFTNEVAKQLKEKFNYRILATQDQERGSQVKISTLHSFALNSLKEYYLSVEKKEFPYEVVDETRTIQSDDEFLSKNHILKFDGILDLCLSTLQQDKRFLEWITRTIYEMFVDEVQDLGPREAQILATLYQFGSLRLFVVGDQRQNIYGWREGTIDNLLKRMDIRPAVFSLSRSYRCPNSVLSFVNRLSFTDCRNQPLNNPANPGEALTYYRARNESEEAAYIAATIKNLQKDEKFDLKETAILVPTSYDFEIIANELNRSQLPFHIFGGQSGLGKMELKNPIQDFIFFFGALERKNYALCRLALSIFPDLLPETLKEGEFQSSLALLRKLKPKNVLIDKLIYQLTSENTQISNYLKNGDDFLALMDLYISTSSRPGENHLKDGDAEILKRFAQSVVETENSLQDGFIQSQYGLEQLISSSNDRFFDFYERTFLHSDFQKEDSYISLSTIHSAKGKEWNYVFIPGLSQDKFPGNPKYRNENAEKKKFYVACTRTRKSLFLSSPVSYNVRKKNGEIWVREYMYPSKFLLGLSPSDT